MDDNLISQDIFLRRECEDIVLKRLQNKYSCGNLALNEVSGADFEKEVSEEMNKRKYFEELERSYGGPPELVTNDPKGRYGWRVNGRNGYFPRGNTIEEVYEKQWQYHLKEVQSANFSQMTLKQLVDRYCEEKKAIGKKVNTVNSWKIYMNFYLYDHWDRAIGSFTKKELADIFSKVIIEKRPSYRTVCNARSATKMFFKYAEEDLNQKLQFSYLELWEKLRDETPIEKIKTKPKLQLFVQSTEDYSAEETRAMIEEAYKRDTLIAYASIISFFVNERISEITGLLAENVNLEEGIIFVKTAFVKNTDTHQYELTDPKKGKYRTIPIPTMAMPIFERIFELRNSNSIYLFAEQNNTHKDEWINSKRLDRHIRNMCRAIGMKKGEEKSAHDQRRTYIKIIDSIALPTALRKILVGHDLDMLEEAYMKTIDLTPDEVRAFLDPAFERFINQKRTEKITPFANYYPYAL